MNTGHIQEFNTYNVLQIGTVVALLPRVSQLPRSGNGTSTDYPLTRTPSFRYNLRDRVRCASMHSTRITCPIASLAVERISCELFRFHIHRHRKPSSREELLRIDRPAKRRMSKQTDTLEVAQSEQLRKSRWRLHAKLTKELTAM